MILVLSSDLRDNSLKFLNFLWCILACKEAFIITSTREQSVMGRIYIK